MVVCGKWLCVVGGHVWWVVMCAGWLCVVVGCVWSVVMCGGWLCMVVDGGCKIKIEHVFNFVPCL